MRIILIILLASCWSCFGQPAGPSDPAFVGQQQQASGFSGPYSPTNNSDGISPVFWLLADDVLASPVTTWTDRTVNAYIGTASPSAPPTTNGPGLNGHNSIHFAATATNYILWGGVVFPQPFEVVAVMRYWSTSGNTYMFDSTNVTASLRCYLGSDSGSALRLYAGANAASTNVIGTKWRVYDSLFSGTQSDILTNNVSCTEGVGLNPGTSSMNGITMAAIQTLASRANIEVAEFLVYSTTNTTVQRSNLFTYLTNRYALP